MLRLAAELGAPLVLMDHGVDPDGLHAPHVAASGSVFGAVSAALQQMQADAASAGEPDSLRGPLFRSVPISYGARSRDNAVATNLRPRPRICEGPRPALALSVCHPMVFCLALSLLFSLCLLWPLPLSDSISHCRTGQGLGCSHCWMPGPTPLG